MLIETEKELDANEIWDLLTPDDFNDLKDMFYDDFKDDYMKRLIDEGQVEGL